MRRGLAKERELCRIELEPGMANRHADVVEQRGIDVGMRDVFPGIDRHRRGIGLECGMALVPARRLLVGVPDAQHRGVLEWTARDLQAERQTSARESA